MDITEDTTHTIVGGAIRTAMFTIAHGHHGAILGMTPGMILGTGLVHGTTALATPMGGVTIDTGIMVTTVVTTEDTMVVTTLAHTTATGMDTTMVGRIADT